MARKVPVGARAVLWLAVLCAHSRLHSLPRSDAGNTFTATAHILTAVVGAGVLALPYSLAMLGW